MRIPPALFPFALFIPLLFVKLHHDINWSWWIITFPLWTAFLTAIAALICVVSKRNKIKSEE